MYSVPSSLIRLIIIVFALKITLPYDCKIQSLAPCKRLAGLNL